MQPKWYDPPKPLSIQVQADTIKESPLGNEVSISLRVNGEDCNVVVPTIALGENKLSVAALQVGEIGENVIVSFPATSLGTSTCSVPKWQIKTWQTQETK